MIYLGGSSSLLVFWNINCYKKIQYLCFIEKLQQIFLWGGDEIFPSSNAPNPWSVLGGADLLSAVCCRQDRPLQDKVGQVWRKLGWMSLVVVPLKSKCSPIFWRKSFLLPIFLSQTHSLSLQKGAGEIFVWAPALPKEGFLCSHWCTKWLWRVINSCH